MAFDDKVCIVCGKHHKYCMTSKLYNKDETWRNLYCSENCMQIFNIYNDFNHNLFGIEEAKKKLENVDLNVSIKGQFKEVIDKILACKEAKAPEKKQAKNEPTQEQPIAPKKPRKRKKSD